MPLTILAIMEFKWLENGNLSGWREFEWLPDYGISLQINNRVFDDRTGSYEGEEMLILYWEN